MMRCSALPCYPGDHHHHRSCMQHRYCDGRQCRGHACHTHGHGCGRVRKRETTRVLNARAPLTLRASSRPPRSTPIFKLKELYFHRSAVFRQLLPRRARSEPRRETGGIPQATSHQKQRGRGVAMRRASTATDEIDVCSCTTAQPNMGR